MDALSVLILPMHSKAMKMKQAYQRVIKATMLCIPLAILTACSGSESMNLEEDDKIGSLPSNIIAPMDNATSEAKVALGKMLFWDPILSGNQDIACASCHHPDFGYAERLDLSVGVGGEGLSAERHSGHLIQRNAPTIINTAFNGIDEAHDYDPSNTQMFWDNRARSLEQQAELVLKSNIEMRGEDISQDDILNVLSERLTNIGVYQRLFNEAFGESAIDEQISIDGEKIVKAIAAFERSIISNNSRFDQYARGDNNALTQQEIRGLNEFIAAGCTGCHSGPMFSDFELHQLPVKDNQKLVNAGIEDAGEAGMFRTPSLRNVGITAPYMHNGTELTLRDALVFYDTMENPGNSEEIAELDFEDVDPEILKAIEAFLHTLTDESFDKTIPAQVPSGLNPGGNIN